jgi:hypothetical protein
LNRLVALEARLIDGDFACADDLLWAAEGDRLAQIGPIRVGRSGRIGPLVEMAMAWRIVPSAYASIYFEAPFARAIKAAISVSRISGSHLGSRAGVFPLSICNSSSGNGGLWDLWATRAESAAVHAHFPRSLAAGLIGALGELQENIFIHSGHPETGLVAFAARQGFFEFAIADAGIGVLGSLRQNPNFESLSDAGAALKLAIEDGNSRFGRSGGRGYGIGQVFRALVGYQAELRFRSDDHALTLRGQSPGLEGDLELAQKASLRGLIVTVLCRSPCSAAGPTARQR